MSLGDSGAVWNQAGMISESVCNCSAIISCTVSVQFGVILGSFRIHSGLILPHFVHDVFLYRIGGVFLPRYKNVSVRLQNSQIVNKVLKVIGAGVYHIGVEVQPSTNWIV